MDFEIGKWYYAPEDGENFETWTFVEKKTPTYLRGIWFVHKRTTKEALEIFEVESNEFKWMARSKLKLMSNDSAKRLFFKVFTLPIEKTKRIRI